MGQQFPHQALQNLKDVEETLYKNIKNSDTKSIWKKLTTNGSVDVTSLRDVLERLQSFLYSFYKGRVIGMSLSPKNTAIRDLGAQKNILALVNKHMAQLKVGKENPDIYKPRSSNHKLANTLRQILIEPFKGELYGFGRYLIVAPDNFTFFIYNISRSARWYAILRRKTNHNSDNRTCRNLENSSQFGSYEPDMLALSRLGKN